MTTYDISGNMVTISNDMENERYLLSTTDEYLLMKLLMSGMRRGEVVMA
jgi:hypothetical protein